MSSEAKDQAIEEALRKNEEAEKIRQEANAKKKYDSISDALLNNKEWFNSIDRISLTIPMPLIYYSHICTVFEDVFRSFNILINGQNNRFGFNFIPQLLLPDNNRVDFELPTPSFSFDTEFMRCPRDNPFGKFHLHEQIQQQKSTCKQSHWQLVMYVSSSLIVFRDKDTNGVFEMHETYTSDLLNIIFVGYQNHKDRLNVLFDIPGALLHRIYECNLNAFLDFKFSLIDNPYSMDILESVYGEDAHNIYLSKETISEYDEKMKERLKDLEEYAAKTLSAKKSHGPYHGATIHSLSSILHSNP